MESVKKDLDTDRPSLVRRIVGEHTVTQKWGAAVLETVPFAAALLLPVVCIGESVFIRKLIYQLDFS